MKLLIKEKNLSQMDYLPKAMELHRLTHLVYHHRALPFPWLTNRQNHKNLLMVTSVPTKKMVPKTQNWLTKLKEQRLCWNLLLKECPDFLYGLLVVLLGLLQDLYLHLCSKSRHPQLKIITMATATNTIPEYQYLIMGPIGGQLGAIVMRLQVKEDQHPTFIR